jgi:predicted TIM-barrel fold metal-dependent hydrolase
MEDIVDTHVHFWDHSVPGLSWAFLEPGFSHPRLGELWRIDAPRFTPAELRVEAAGLGVSRVVHIQAAKSADPIVETEWLQGLSDQGGWPNAIIGWCDLRAPDIAEVVAGHARFAVFRGVRDLASGEHLGDEDVARGFAAVADAGCSLEVMTSCDHYDQLLKLLDPLPELAIVLGHSGLAVQRDDDYFRTWSAGMRRIANDTSAVCKISALASGPDPQWSLDSIRRWFHGCIEAFGPDRCMIGSNWPIDSMFGTYVRLLTAYEQLLGELSPDEAAEVSHGTAERFYRL